MRSLCKYKELYHGATESLKDHVYDTPHPRKADLLAYMTSKQTDGVAAGVARDQIDGKTRIGLPVACNDGEYSWTTELIYYVDKYNLQLPDDFVAHALN
jgi:hypothetical protein